MFHEKNFGRFVTDFGLLSRKFWITKNGIFTLNFCLCDTKISYLHRLCFVSRVLDQKFRQIMIVEKDKNIALSLVVHNSD